MLIRNRQLSIRNFEDITMPNNGIINTENTDAMNIPKTSRN